ncbi:hypothetical protein [Nocardia asiatica]|uniref:hypothetical protein n=1 Tax=Nocardia asiatica TaxID=209252 RepID=UPI002458EEFB|nr:hypothetical protein [Nocardia asiatica]
MAAFLISLALILAFATWIAHSTGRAGSSNIVDRDAERLNTELTAVLGRNTHHR